MIMRWYHIAILMAVGTFDCLIIYQFPALVEVAKVVNPRFDYSKCEWIIPSLEVSIDDRTIYREHRRTPEGRWCVH